tara:strand:- start:3124 stop:3699 length:576 start_codon:yes stop_codon:yes gene_type:complete
MKLLEFELIDRSYRYDMNMDAPWWSRIYEYPLVLDLLNKYGADKDSALHNTCWGFEGCHVWFKEILDKKYPLNINSDIRKSDLPNTFLYNITEPPKKEWIESFDFVINISTLEEVPQDHIDTFHQSFSMIKPGGYFICTFDLPGLQLEEFETLFNKKINRPDSPISGINSELQNATYFYLNCGYMVVQKDI